VEVSRGNPVLGYLKVQDIFNLSVHTQLVVLSACNSGLGELIDGEGSIGLTYAFLHAGAKQVISTLWSVDDETTQELMSEFYKAMLLDGDSPSRALRKAVVIVMHQGRTVEPYYWAPYVITADSLGVLKLKPTVTNARPPEKVSTAGQP
jgi:CHAT domain-containing protein